MATVPIMSHWAVRSCTPTKVKALYEEPDHPSNVFWHQALEANKLYDMFDGKQRKQSLVVQGMPSEELVGFRGPEGDFQG